MSYKADVLSISPLSERMFGLNLSKLTSVGSNPEVLSGQNDQLVAS